MMRSALPFLLVAGVFAPGLLVAAQADAPPAAAVRAAHGAADKKSTRCEACHTEDAWLPARFAHERTGFPLRGQHRRADCGSCHDADFEREVPVSCSACHRDVHSQQFGLMCQGCHDESSWKPRFAVDAHRSTGFPLSGRHATLPCEECHRDRRDRRFGRVAVACSTCHMKDLLRASARVLDHQRSKVSASCRDCHQPTAFTPAVLPQHEPCFPILTGPHRVVRCAECHRGSTGLVASGRCDGTPVSCTSCHTHRCDVNADQHAGVAGYVCTDVRCASCHTR